MSPREDRYTNTEKDAGLYDRAHFAQPADRPSKSDLADEERTWDDTVADMIDAENPYREATDD